MQKTILLLKRALDIPYVNRIVFFCFLYIKTFRKKIVFCIWMKITMTAISERQRARLYTQKVKKNCETFLYTKSQTHFKNLDNFRYVLYTKSNTLDVTGFSWKFWTRHLYTKSMTLFVTWRFYIQKARHFAKSKTICDRFFKQKSGTFALRNFLLNFWNLRRGWDIYSLKKM